MKIENGYICHRGRQLCKCGSLLADSKELVSLDETQGVIHRSTPYRIDLLFCADDKLVGVECKRPDDFVTSWQARRLARQVKTLLEYCDIAIVGVRGVLATAKPYKPVNWERLWSDVVGWQLQGVIFLEMPESDQGIHRYMVHLKEMLSRDNPSARALAGSDRGRSMRERNPGWYLRRIPSIGPTASVKLIEHFGTVAKALSATDEEWKKVGMTARHIRERGKALNE